MPRRLFRTASLERMSTPDRLDALLGVARRGGWIPLLVLVLALACALAWGVYGRIPVTVEGVAVLVHPRQVVAFQSPASGQLLTIEVRVGDVVRKGQRLATLHLPELQRQLETERQRLVEFRVREGTLAELEQAQARREKSFLARQRTLINQRVSSLRTLAGAIKEKNEAFCAEQRKTLDVTRSLSRELAGALKERFESVLAMRKKGLISQETLVAARQSYIDIKLKLAELDVQIHQLALREIQAEEGYLKQLDLVADLDVQLQQLALSEARIDRRLLEASLSVKRRTRSIEREIARLESQLRTRGHLISEHEGQVLEVTAAAGSIVTAGQRIGTLAATVPGRPLTVLAYFPVAEGKQVRAGMAARITPSTVRRARHGSIVGEVTGVSDYPVTTEAAINQLGNRELAHALTGGRSRIEVLARPQLDADTPSGFRWTSARGPDVQLTAGTTARVRVTLEQRAPITLVLPALRAWFGEE